jgi:Rps23 Pro-64 3,4-dihydroxylase Tpa1-like proline 4-hydroxylase
MVSILTPYRMIQGFLDPGVVADLLDYAAGREADFQPTRVGWGEGAQRRENRVSHALRDLGPYRAILKKRIFSLMPEIVKDLRLTGVVEPLSLETQLVAHGDGAFYGRHIDLQNTDRDDFRAVSGVYYFNREPKAFTGGALRLYAIGDNDRFVDIEPVNNALLVFPSWAPHEVRPVSVASKCFLDSRFAINCWVHHKKSPNRMQ